MEILARVGRKFELYQIRSNSSQVGGQTIPNSIKVVNLARVGQTVENLARVGRKFELDQIQANSSQVVNEVVNLARVGLSWEEPKEPLPRRRALTFDSVVSSNSLSV